MISLLLRLTCVILAVSASCICVFWVCGTAYKVLNGRWWLIVGPCAHLALTEFMALDHFFLMALRS